MLGWVFALYYPYSCRLWSHQTTRKAETIITTILRLLLPTGFLLHYQEKELYRWRVVVEMHRLWLLLKRDVCTPGAMVTSVN